MSIRATKICIGLPFQLGSIEFEPNEVEQNAAWSLYIELMTRVAVQPLHCQEGLLREVLDSVRSLFELTREVLREAGPEVANNSQSLGPIALDILNKGIRPFTAKWHPLLLAHEEKRTTDKSQLEHERDWKYYKEMRQELAIFRAQ